MTPPQDNAANTVTDRPLAGPPAGQAKVNAENPWPGLEAYDESSSDLFYGRKQETAELLRLIYRAPLTVVYGKSGLGKTSLLQAGLFPLLRQNHFLPVLLRLDFAEETKTPPLEQVKQRLREALDQAKAEYLPIESDESLWEYLHRRKSAEIWSKDNFPLTPVLVFDQFEELFSRTGGNVEIIRQVFNQLADLIENRIPVELTSETARQRRSRLDLLSQRYCVVLSFREDFLPEIRSWEKQVPSLLRNYLRLEPMSRESAIEAVEQGGKTVLEEGVASCIVDLVGNRDQQRDPSETSEMVIEPVLLSLCCTQLNLRRAPGARIDKALVDEAGQDILESFYLGALEDAEVRGEPDAARFIEDYLVQGDRYRGDYPKQEALEENKLRKEQLAALTDRLRLLRIVYRGDTARIELIHDRIVPVVSKVRDQRRIQAQQEETERKAQAAEAERDRERARSEELTRERDVARRLRNWAVLATVVSLALVVWVWHEKKAREMSKLSRDIAVDTSRLAEGRLELQVGSEPMEQTMYRALATYRLSTENKELAEARTASLSALELVLTSSGHLAKVLRLRGIMPTPALAYSPDGKTLAVGGEDGLIWLLDVNSYSPVGAPLDCQPKAASVWALAFNRDGTRLAAGYNSNDDNVSGAGLVCVFDVQQGSIKQKWSNIEHGRKGADIDSVAYGGKPEHEFVVFGGTDKTLRQLDVNTGEVVEVNNVAEVVAVAVSSDDSRVATGGDDAVIRVWNQADLGKQNIKPLELKGHGATVEQIVFSPADRRVLVSTGDDGRIIAWNVDKSCRTQQSDVQEAKIYGLAITSKGTLLAAAGRDGYVRLFSVSDTYLACDQPKNSDNSSKPPKIEVISDGVLSGHGGMILAVAFDPHEEHLASAGQDGSIRIWMRNTGSFSRVSLELDRQAPGSLTAVAVSPDANLVAAGDDKGQIHVWKPPTDNGEPIRESPVLQWAAHSQAINSLIYVTGGSQLMIVSGGEDGVLKRWNPATEEMIGSPMADDAAPVVSIALSPDGATLAAGSRDGSVRLWDAATGKLQKKIDAPKDQPDYRLNAVGFSRDGRYVATCSLEYSEVRVVSVKEGRERLLHGHNMGVSSVSYGEREWLLSSGSDGTVMEWEEAALDRREVSGLRKHDEFKYRTGSPELRHPQPLTAMAASNDGNLILTGGKDGQIQLWDGTEHVLISDQFSGRQGDIKAVALAPRGNFFVTADASTILVWPGPDHWADVLCSKLAWNMSREHWNQWVSPKIPYTEQCPGLKEEPAETSKASQ